MNFPDYSLYPEILYVGVDKIPYKVRFVINKKWRGKCSHKRRTIYVNLPAEPGEIFSTFLHELLHALEFEYNIDIKHKTVYALEEGLIACLVNNSFTKEIK